MKTKGWRKVFSFTFIQYIKTKSFIVGTIIICVITAAICVLTNVLPAALMKSDDEPGTGDEVSAPEDFFKSGRLYLFDDADILADDDRKELEAIFGERFSEPGGELADTIETLKNSEALEAAVVITENTDEDGKLLSYGVKCYYTSEAKSSADTVNAVISEFVNHRIMLNAGVDPDKYAMTKIGVYSSKTEAGGKALSELQGMVNGMLPLLVSIVLFLLIFPYGQVVAQSIATEKTSRVMELLLTSVRPLAVVIGKVLAMGAVCFLQFFVIILTGVASFAISAPFGWVSGAMKLLDNPEITNALAQIAEQGTMGSVAGVSVSDMEMASMLFDIKGMITPFNIAAIVVIFILGFLVFALIAALVGASVSRMEDLQAAMQPYSIIGVLGMYLAYFPAIFNAETLAGGEATTNPVQIFSFYFPISSPFALPSAVMLGTLDKVGSVISIVVLAAFVVLIAILVSKVYEAIILHNGNRIKFGDILKMAARK